MHGCMANLYTLCGTKLSPQFHLSLKLLQVNWGLFFWDIFFLLSILNIILTCLQASNIYLEHFKVLYFLLFSDILCIMTLFFILAISKDCLLKLSKYSV